MRRFLHRPSPAMIVALIALVAATSGSAIADGANAIIAKLKNNSVTSATVKNGSLKVVDFNKKEAAKLKGATGPAGAAGPQGPAGTPDGYTKTEADAAFLGKAAKAADSAKLGGNDASTYVQGGGTQGQTSVLMAGGATDATLATLPSLGNIKVSCTVGSPETMGVTIANDQSSTVRFSYSLIPDGAATRFIGGAQLAASGTFPLNLGGSNSQVLIQLNKTTGVGLFTTNYYATVLLTAITNPGGDADKCRYQAVTQTGQSGLNFLILLP